MATLSEAALVAQENTTGGGTTFTAEPQSYTQRARATTSVQEGHPRRKPGRVPLPANSDVEALPRSPRLPPSPNSEPSLLAYASPPPPRTSSPCEQQQIPSHILAHPHAPKPTPSNASVRPAIHRNLTTTSLPPSPPNMGHRALLNTLAMASAAGHQHGPLHGKATIHGRTSHDLLSASGPVPIEFALKRSESSQASVDASREQPVLAPSSDYGSVDNVSTPQPIVSNHALARPNFAPAVATQRPRSRSFSDIINAIETPSAPLLGSHIMRGNVPRGKMRPGMSSNSLPSTPVLKGFSIENPDPKATNNTTSRAPSNHLVPSVAVQPAPRPRPSSPPLRRKLSKPPPLPSLNRLNNRVPGPVSAGSSPRSFSGTAVNSSVPTSPQPQEENQYQPTMDKTVQDLSTNPPRYPPDIRSAQESDESFHARILQDYGVQISPKETTQTSSHGVETTLLPSALPASPTSSSISPISRTQSLRSRISLPALRSNARRRQDSTHTTDVKEETIEVEDMEFTLVRPIITTHKPPTSESEDVVRGSESVHSFRDGLSLPNDSLQPDRESARSYSPIPSPLSPTSLSPTMSPFEHSFPPLFEAPRTEVAESLAPSTRSIQSHMQLELKWISAMAAIPSAEAKKSRKIRKLVIDGIPASVRGVVWLYLTDSKGRRMPDLYAQFCRRGKVAASNDIWTDIQSHFVNHLHLKDPDGPLMSVLQAYLCMVPDTVYNFCLTLVAGHILLQTPEEDAFWTFVALMDNHLRGYFSPTARLLEIDSALFERAIFSFDKALANRIFVDLRLNCVDICRHWFPSSFSAILPATHLNRVWDAVMFFEGPMFLFRLGLATLSFSRNFVMDPHRCRTSSDALTYFQQPPREIWPSDPDQIIFTAMAAKLKEDELRKLRPKVELLVRKRQAPVRSNTSPR